MWNVLFVLVHTQGKTTILCTVIQSNLNLRFLPDFPHLDNECDQIALLAFPLSIQNRDRDIVWLLCKNIQDLK